MGALPSKASYTSTSHNHNILQEVIKSRFKTLSSALSFIVYVIVYHLSFPFCFCSSVEDSLVRNYGRSFNGFAAKLSESERDKLIGMEGVVSVFPCTVYKLLTTSSYEFLGLGDKSKQVPEGRSINDFDLKGKKYSLANGKTASNNCIEELARGCASGCLNTVQGNIVVCDA
ncbi:hypothetical protein Bca4012_023957 [Brassica carinata]